MKPLVVAVALLAACVTNKPAEVAAPKALPAVLSPVDPQLVPTSLDAEEALAWAEQAAVDQGFGEATPARVRDFEPRPVKVVARADRLLKRPSSIEGCGGEAEVVQVAAAPAARGMFLAVSCHTERLVAREGVCEIDALAGCPRGGDAVVGRLAADVPKP